MATQFLLTVVKSQTPSSIDDVVVYIKKTFTHMSILWDTARGIGRSSQ